MSHIFSYHLFDTIVISYPFILPCISILAWVCISWWTWYYFPTTERLFFSVADKECRAFVSENYSNSSVDLGEFKFPSSYGANKPIALFTFMVGAVTLLIFTFLKSIGLLELIFIFFALFFAQRLTWFDSKHLFLPDGDIAAFGFFSLILAIFFNQPEDWQYVALSALILASFLWILTNTFKLFTGKEGIGMGDIKFLFAMHPLLSFSTLTHVLLLANIFGLFWWIIKKIHRKETTSQFPFGPFLFLGWVFALINLKHSFLPW